jgi:hypothetical protein
VSPYLITSITRRRTSTEVQDIVSTIGDNGQRRPLASTIICPKTFDFSRVYLFFEEKTPAYFKEKNKESIA